jgi:hypothetical protein
MDLGVKMLQLSYIGSSEVLNLFLSSDLQAGYKPLWALSFSSAQNEEDNFPIRNLKRPQKE